MNESTIIVAGMTCGNCVKHVTEELLAVPGITQVRVDLVGAGGALPRRGPRAFGDLGGRR